MPNYDFQCAECKQTEEVFCKIAELPKQRCSACGGSVKQVFKSPQVVAPFKAGYYEHIALEPIYCGSKRQLKSECDRRGCTSIYASEW